MTIAMSIILSICVLLILDISWITLSKKMYAALVGNVQKSPMKVNMIYAIVAYVLMILGFVYFTVPLLNASKIKSNIFNALRYGGLFGFIVYGIYNATNLAIFQSYSLLTGLIDTLWGSLVYTGVSYVYLKLKSI
jgi:uncharacterized membrane protein